MHFDQAAYDVRCEWSADGVRELAPASDAIIIVDVLSFSTSVDVATSLGAAVYPYRWKDASARAFAERVGAKLAGHRAEGGLSLSPASLMELEPGSRLVLPSPNGSTLSVGTGQTPTYAGCLRNARSVARHAARSGPKVSVIPAGERWPDGGLRVSLEDWLGAGAVIWHLKGSKSPEAAAAEAVFLSVRDRIRSVIACSGSGQELFSGGYGQDLEMACEFLVSVCVPRLVDGAYVNVGEGGREAGRC
jgi:2-phosphosulfolactate phosphatase